MLQVIRCGNSYQYLLVLASHSFYICFTPSLPLSFSHSLTYTLSLFLSLSLCSHDVKLLSFSSLPHSLSFSLLNNSLTLYFLLSFFLSLTFSVRLPHRPTHTPRPSQINKSRHPLNILRYQV
jgi:hypothetical protein